MRWSAAQHAQRAASAMQLRSQLRTEAATEQRKIWGMRHARATAPRAQ